MGDIDKRFNDPGFQRGGVDIDSIDILAVECLGKHLLANTLLQGINPLLAGSYPHRLAQNGFQTLAVGKTGHQWRTAGLWLPLISEAINDALSLGPLRHNQQRQAFTILTKFFGRFCSIRRG